MTVIYNLWQARNDAREYIKSIVLKSGVALEEWKNIATFGPIGKTY
jgi:hypothetical protein